MHFVESSRLPPLLQRVARAWVPVGAPEGAKAALVAVSGASVVRRSSSRLPPLLQGVARAWVPVGAPEGAKAALVVVSGASVIRRSSSRLPPLLQRDSVGARAGLDKLADEHTVLMQTARMGAHYGELLLSCLYGAMQDGACRFHVYRKQRPKLDFRLSLASIRAAIIRAFSGRAATTVSIPAPRVAPAPLPSVPAEVVLVVVPAPAEALSMAERHDTAGPESAPGEPVAPAAIVAAPDPDAERLLVRRALLESQMLDFSSRLADMAQQVRRYEQHQYRALGEVLGECLRLRQEYLSLKAARSGAAGDREQARQADEDFDAYRRSTAYAVAPLPELDDDEQDELRRLYRAAAMRCHPDRAAEAERAEAHDVFLRVQAAYQGRDLESLRRISAELAGWARPDAEASAAAAGSAATSSGVRRRIAELQIQVADLILAVQTLQLDPAYRQAVQVERWDADFAAARAGFEAECEALRAQIAQLASRRA